MSKFSLKSIHDDEAESPNRLSDARNRVFNFSMRRSRSSFDSEVAYGSMYVGSPETVAQKIARAMKAVGAERFDTVYGFGPVPAAARRHMIELYGHEVIPRVRELLAEKDAA